MSNYRILEKKGTYEDYPCSSSVPCDDTCDEHLLNVYIPRYIVQEVVLKSVDIWGAIIEYEDSPPSHKDLREFTDLEEARRFKNDLELEEGRVVE